MQIIEIMYFDPDNTSNKCYLPVGDRNTDELKEITEIQAELFNRSEHKFVVTETV